MEFSFGGKARKFVEYDASVEIPISKISEDFLKSKGILNFKVKVGNQETEWRSAHHPCKWFYYSGHGHHKTGALEYAPGPRLIFPSTLAPLWKTYNISNATAILAGCSVLDIKDYANDQKPSEHFKSPGEKWIKTNQSLLLGYRQKAPRDINGSDRIINNWYLGCKNSTNTDIDMDKAAKSWQKANLKNRSWTACAIDRRKKPHRYHYYYKWPNPSLPWPISEVIPVTIFADSVTNDWPSDNPDSPQE